MKPNSLKKYLAASAALAGASSLNAQIVYTNVTPDVVLSGQGSNNYDIDLNHDGTVDFSVQFYYYNSVYSSSNSFNVNLAQIYGNTSAAFIGRQGTFTVGTSGPSSYIAVDVLNQGEVIAQAGNWMSSSSSGFLAARATGTYGGSPINLTLGDWFNKTGKFVGVKFQSASGTHHGWIRLSVSADGKAITVKDYAYQGSVSAPILAGAVSGGVVGVEEQSMLYHVHITNSFGQVFVENYQGEEGTVDILNLSGQVVKAEALDKSKNTINTGDLSTGIYFVVVTTDSGVMKQKIYLH